MDTPQDSLSAIPRERYEQVAQKLLEWARTLSPEEQHVLGTMIAESSQLFDESHGDVSGYGRGQGRGLGPGQGQGQGQGGGQGQGKRSVFNPWSSLFPQITDGTSNTLFFGESTGR